MLINNKIWIKFLKHVILNQLPKDKQQARGKGDNFWCCDWWTIEMTKYIYLGEKKYLETRKPRWLQKKIYNVLADLQRATQMKEKMFNHLIKLQNDADDLLVCEVAHGIDIIIALQVKKWNQIYCYDQVNYQPSISKFFNSYYNINPIFFLTSSYGFNYDKIQSNGCIVLVNYGALTKEKETYDKFLNNSKTVHFIEDGILKK